MKTASILIVEDEAIVAKSIEKRLGSLGYTIVGTAATGIEAIRLAGHTRPDLVLLDILLKGSLDGVEVSRVLREWFRIPVIFVTAFADNATIERASETGPYGYLLKPFGEKDLLSAIAVALSRIEREKMDLSGISPDDPRYPGTLDDSPVPLAIIDPDTRIILTNRAFDSYTGYSCTQAPDVPSLAALVAGEDFRTVSEYLRIFHIDPTVAPSSIRVRLKTGISGAEPVTLRLGRIEKTSLITIAFPDNVPSERD